MNTPGTATNGTLETQHALRRIAGSVDSVMGANANVVLWRPSGLGGYATWAEVYAAVQDADGPVTILVDRAFADPALTIPAGIYDMKNASFDCASNGSPGVATIDVANGGVLLNVKQIFGNLTLVGHSTVLPVLVNVANAPGTSATYIFGYGAAIRNDGTAPMILVPNATTAVARAIESVGFSVSPAHSAIFGVGTGSTLTIEAFGALYAIDPDMVYTADAAANLYITHNGQVPMPLGPFPNFAGHVYNVPTGTNGGSGLTTGIPGSPGRPPTATTTIGCSYFDTDLALPIWFDGNGGTHWANAAGAPV